MQLDSHEKSHAWWKGVFKGAVKGLLIGLVIGAATALALGGLCAVPAFAPVLSPVFAGFFTMSGGFSMVPLALFSGISGMVGGMLNGGNAAVEGIHLKKHFDWQQKQDQKIAELDGREQVIEQTVLPQSRNVQAILARGPKSHTDAELDRANAPSTNTLQ